MPPNENGASELMKKILNRKDKIKEHKESEGSPIREEQHEPRPEPRPNVPQAHHRFAPQTGNDERMDEVADMGNLTAADLRKSSMGK